MFEPHRFAFKSAVTAALVAYGAAAYAVAPFRVQDVRIVGLQRISARTVFAYLPIRRGDMFTDDTGSQAIRALFATGFFNDVKIATEGRTVIVVVQERPVISDVDFSGIKEFDKSTLTKALKAVGLAGGQYYDKSLLNKAEQELRRQYLARGYYASTVNATITPIDVGRINVLLSVIEGPKAKLRQVNFIGNHVFSARTLGDQMRLSTPNWFSWYTHNDLYSKDKLTEDLQHLRDFYLNHGYPEFTIDSTQVEVSPDKRSMYLTIALHEGQPYTVSRITLAGNLLDKKAELEKLLTVKAGDTFSAEELRASTKALVDKIGEYGYAFATVDAQPQFDREHHTVALTMNVNLGKRIYVRRINISGNVRTRDEVIRREMRQMEGAWFDSSRLKLSEDRLNRLGYFTDVQITTTPVESAPDEVDVNVKVAEKPTGSMLFGAGFSSTDKVILSAGISQDNVFGTGNSLSVNVNTAKAYRTLAITQINPYFTVDGIQRITDVFYRTYQPLLYTNSSSNFKIISAGADLKFGVPFSESDMVFFGLGFENDRFNTDATTPQIYQDYIKQFGTSVNNAPITVGWTHDARDSALVPSRGYYVQASSELGTPAGKTQYYKADFNAQYYHSFARGFVLGLNAQAGYGHGVSGKPFPIFKNYFAGGIGSVRGYQPSSLGTRDPVTGDPIGGNKLLVGNIELTFPLPGTGYDRTLRVFTFADGGNVWSNEGNSSAGGNGLRYSYGLGLAWISPIGPLKFSLGFPIVKHTGDQYQKFQFQIGTAF